MNCPDCGKETNICEIANQYFLGRNSSNIPFFKCSECGSIFYIKGESAKSVPRGEKGYRFVPLTWGVLLWSVAGAVLWVYGSNVITIVVSGILFLFGWTSMRVGLFGSQSLIDEMCLDEKSPLSKKSKNEWNDINYLE